MKIFSSKSEKKKKIILPVVFAVLVLITAAALLHISGGFPSKPQTPENFTPASQRFFLPAENENGQTVYYMAEIVYPKDYDGKMPLIAVGHGFKGSLNSGGAAELSERLACTGYAAVRMDFNPRTQPKKNAEKTGFYDLTSMKDTMICAIRYACENFEINENRIGLYARSMGGRVVMTMANESYGGFDYKALAMVAPAGNETAMIHYAGGRKKWDEMKQKAHSKGYVEYQGLKLTEDWFKEFEEYNPCDYGSKFGDKPVLVICNTLDYVVTEDTSLECAHAYKNSRVITVTTENYHGYEMSYKESDLKDYLMDEIVDFFKKEL